LPNVAVRDRGGNVPRCVWQEKEEAKMTQSVKTGRGTRPRGTRIDVWVTPEERAEITERASQTGLSASAYLRTAAFACSVPSLINRDALDDFVRLSGELNEVGRLLKLWLDGNLGEDGVDVSVL